MTKELKKHFLDLYTRLLFVEQLKVDPTMGHMDRGYVISTLCSFTKNSKYCRLVPYGKYAKRKVKIQRCDLMRTPACSQKVFYADNVESIVKYILRWLDKPMCRQHHNSKQDSLKGF